MKTSHATGDFAGVGGGRRNAKASFFSKVKLWPRREAQNAEKCETLVDSGLIGRGRRDARGPV